MEFISKHGDVTIKITNQLAPSSGRVYQNSGTTSRRPISSTPSVSGSVFTGFTGGEASWSVMDEFVKAYRYLSEDYRELSG